MKTVATLGNTTRAWIAKASDITVKDLDALQKQFAGKLNIQRTTKHGTEQVVIFPDCGGDRTAFDTFMEANGAFTKQTVDINRL